MVFPWVCAVCGDSNDIETGICNLCRTQLPWCGSVCYVCGLPVSGQKATRLVCGICQKKPPYYDCTRAVFWYQSPIDKLITDYKYFNCWENGRTLIDLIRLSLSEIPNDALVLPVPSHPARVRERGFNAVYELIRLLRHRVKFNCDLDCIRRVNNTETQTGKAKSQRRNNVRNAFTIIKPIPSDHVVIFDEVVTTGATVNELSRCLKKTGVKKVEVRAIARTK